jgi:3-phenylpropionate/cinnamic acid dioxygenase small subunit
VTVSAGRVADLLPRVAALCAEYARAIDDDRLEEWPDFFASPCLYKITSAENHRLGLPAGLIYADSRGMLTDRVTALREANIYERQGYRHLVGLPAILGETDDGVRADTPFLVVRIMATGRWTSRHQAIPRQLVRRQRPMTLPRTPRGVR